MYIEECYEISINKEFFYGKANPNMFLIIGNPFYCDSYLMAYDIVQKQG